MTGVTPHLPSRPPNRSDGQPRDKTANLIAVPAKDGWALASVGELESVGFRGLGPPAVQTGAASADSLLSKWGTRVVGEGTPRAVPPMAARPSSSPGTCSEPCVFAGSGGPAKESTVEGGAGGLAPPVLCVRLGSGEGRGRNQVWGQRGWIPSRSDQPLIGSRTSL